MTENTKLKYRPDIDGLRCVAVLSVLAFHISPNRLPGGFVGVDIFFVISGYLISSILFSQVSEGRFSILLFYERRVRRIFPALFAMLIGVSVLMVFFLLPNEFVTYAYSVGSATFSASNFFFWTHSGYFNSPESNPLLHTWSLAVEEQFYILFPIALVIARQVFRQRLKLGVFALFFVSLALSELAVRRNATTAFYMPYSRAWELLLGTIVSMGVFPRLRNVLLREAAALLGIGMIGFTLLRYSDQTPFPGLAAMVPCIGSALIIAAGESGSSLVGRSLSVRPIVFVGLISYSLYLWHWPLIVLKDRGCSINISALVPQQFATYLYAQTTNKILTIVWAFLLAVLSWKFVERPFRAYSGRIGRRSLFALSATMMIVLLAGVSAIVYSDGFPARFPKRAMQIASVGQPFGQSSLGQLGDCAITRENQSSVFMDDHCLKTIVGENTYLLLGDSHAAALWQGLRESLRGANVVLAAVWGCSPAIRSAGTPVCRELLDFVFRKYLPSHPVKRLLLEAQWHRVNLIEAQEIVKWAKGHGVEVTIFGTVAEYDAPLPTLLAYSIAWNEPQLAERHRAAYSVAMDRQMQSLAEQEWHVCYASLYAVTCGKDGCIEYADEKRGIPLLTDADHLSKEGSALIVARMTALGELTCMENKGAVHPDKLRAQQN